LVCLRRDAYWAQLACRWVPISTGTLSPQPAEVIADPAQSLGQEDDITVLTLERQLEMDRPATQSSFVVICIVAVVPAGSLKVPHGSGAASQLQGQEVI
jgi:hypothetical protein